MKMTFEVLRVDQVDLVIFEVGEPDDSSYVMQHCRQVLFNRGAEQVNFRAYTNGEVRMEVLTEEVASA